MARLNRREFVLTGTAAGLAAAAPATVFGQAPATTTRNSTKPVVVSYQAASVQTLVNLTSIAVAGERRVS